jgi:AraC-like DNA-binding protein
MAVLIDTESVAPPDRFAYWSAAQARLFFPMDVRPLAGTTFAGRARSYDVGPVKVRWLASSGHRVRRTRRAIAADDPEQLELTLLLDGTQQLRQAGRVATLGPGDLTSIDSSHPYAVLSPAPFEMLVFSVPKAMLRPALDGLARRTAVTIPSGGGLAGLVAPFLRGVAEGLRDGIVGERDSDVGEGVADLVRGLYADRRDAPAAPRAELLGAIHRHIDARLHDPGLRPAGIAAAHFISTRSLHRLFEEQGVTVSAWVRARRLERCRRDLEDPALAGETVLAIARRWGFHNLGHFGRTFREAYGCAPGEVRPTRER